MISIALRGIINISNLKYDNKGEKIPEKQWIIDVGDCFYSFKETEALEYFNKLKTREE